MRRSPNNCQNILHPIPILLVLALPKPQALARNLLAPRPLRSRMTIHDKRPAPLQSRQAIHRSREHIRNLVPHVPPLPSGQDRLCNERFRHRPLVHRNCLPVASSIPQWYPGPRRDLAPLGHRLLYLPRQPYLLLEVPSQKQTGMRPIPLILQTIGPDRLLDLQDLKACQSLHLGST